MNREKECEKIATIFFEKSKTVVSASIEFRCTITVPNVTCNVWANVRIRKINDVLPRLRDASFSNRLKKIQEEKDYTEAGLGWLRNLQYVDIDLRSRLLVGIDFVRALRRCLLAELQELVARRKSKGTGYRDGRGKLPKQGRHQGRAEVKVAPNLGLGFFELESKIILQRGCSSVPRSSAVRFGCHLVSLLVLPFHSQWCVQRNDLPKSLLWLKNPNANQ